MKNGMGNNRAVQVATIALMTFCAFLIAEIVTYSNNSLFHRPEWTSGKFLLAEPIMGGDIYWTRQLFGGNRLNLAVWHGQNEILLREPFTSVSEIGARIFLPPSSHVDLIFNKDQHGFFGARFSNDPDFPSMIYRADDDGKFVTRWRLDMLVTASRWSDAVVHVKPGKLTIVNDGTSYDLDIDVPTDKPQLIGFRGRFSDVLIDDLVVRDADMAIVFREDFRNDKYWMRIFVISLAVLLLLIVISAAIGLVAHRTYALPATIPAVLVGLCASLLLIFCFDYYYWSRIYHFEESKSLIESELSVPALETKRARFAHYVYHHMINTVDDSSRNEPANSFLSRIGKTRVSEIDVKLAFGHRTTSYVNADASQDASIVSKLSRDKSFNESIKVLLIGTSQTWGSGAIRPEDRIDYRLKRMIEDKVPGDREVFVVNISKRGSLSRALAGRYRDHYSKLYYDLVVINLGVNDNDTSRLRAGVRDIVGRTDSGRTKVILLLEACAFEDAHMLESHDVTRDMGRQLKLQVFDLNGFLRNKDLENVGLLYNDAVHLTSYGQQLAAEFISDVIAGQINGKSGTNSSAPAVQGD